MCNSSSPLAGLGTTPNSEILTRCTAECHTQRKFCTIKPSLHTQLGYFRGLDIDVYEIAIHSVKKNVVSIAKKEREKPC